MILTPVVVSNLPAPVLAHFHQGRAWVPSMVAAVKDMDTMPSPMRAVKDMDR